MTSEQITVLVLLCIACGCMVFIVWLILFRLRDHLISRSYQAHLVAYLLWILLCFTSIVLIFWTIPEKFRTIIQLIRYSLIAISCILSAAAFYIYTKEVKDILESDSYTETLPAVPPANGQIHDTRERKDLENGKAKK